MTSATRCVRRKPWRLGLGGWVVFGLVALGMGAAPLPSRAEVDNGSGWIATRLDMVITPQIDRAILQVAGTLFLRLDAPASQGPTLTLNGRGPAIRFLRAEAPGATSTMNDTLRGLPAIRSARLHLAKPARQGETLEIAFACEGEAKGYQVLVRPEIALASWVEAWYPSPLPAMEEEAGNPAAVSGSTSFRLPKGWRAVTNGRRVESTDCGAQACERWVTEEAVMRSFAAAPYREAQARAGNLDVGVYCLSAPLAVAEKKATVLARALNAMERRFGPYPYPTYAIAEVPEGMVEWAAGSEQGFILVKSSILADSSENLPLFAHEAAHGWWGNLVQSKEPGAKFCSESLAEYSAVTAIEDLEGNKAAAEFLEYSRPGYNPLQSALGYFTMWRDGGDKPMSELADDKWDHNLADSKGAWVLHMLRGAVGDSAFFGALRGVIRSYQGKSISLRELEAALAAAAPDRGVHEYFQQWLYGRGAPVLNLDWWSVDRGRGVEVTVSQLQPGEPLRFPLEIEVGLRGGGTERRKLRVSERTEKFHLEVPARAESVEIDPDRRLLVWRPAYGPRPMEETK